MGEEIGDDRVHEALEAKPPEQQGKVRCPAEASATGTGETNRDKLLNPERLSLAEGHGCDTPRGGTWQKENQDCPVTRSVACSDFTGEGIK